MYGYDYEEDVLLSLRVLRYLYEESPVRAQEVADIFKALDPDEMYEFVEYAFWDIFTDAAFDSEDDSGMGTIDVSHPAIDRFYELAGQLELSRGGDGRGSCRKIHDVVEFFLCGASYSLYDFNVQFCGIGVRVKLTLSTDCYDPLPFFNSFIDMLLYFQQENQRIEELLRIEEEKATEQNRKGAA